MNTISTDNTAVQVTDTDKGIILFDGVCNYCNFMVNFVLKRDKKDRFLFAPLQSEAGQELRRRYGIAESIDSFIYIENNKAGIYSTGVLRVCRRMGGFWSVFAALLVLPVFLRDPLYKWIARNRYRWFGRKDACMVPTPAVRRKFLQ